MDNFQVKLRIFSPRWGHEDLYTFDGTMDELVITMVGKQAKCSFRENLDPEWTGESLESILRNDSICPPSVLPRLIEHAWEAWRNGEINNTELEAELQHLASWLNNISKTKPNSAFWRKYF